MQRLERQLCTAIRKRVLGEKARVPEAGQVLMHAFTRLSHARTWSAHAPNPIGFMEIEAWARLMQVPLRPIDVTIIRAMDSAFLDGWIARRDTHQENGVKRLPPVSQQPISAALFDMVSS